VKNTEVILVLMTFSSAASVVPPLNGLQRWQRGDADRGC
jgi:hypothetical protein